MSKETPEVGDVWENKLNGIRVFVFEISNSFVYVLYRDIETDYFDKQQFVKYFSYIGKAKGSIYDLFEVEDENS